MGQLKLFSDKEVFTINRPTITMKQKNMLIERWSSVMYENCYSDLLYEYEEDRIDLEKILLPIFDMPKNMFGTSESTLQSHLEKYLSLPDECDEDEWEEYDKFKSDIILDIVDEIKENVKCWVNAHDLKLTLNIGDVIGDKIIISRNDETYQYTYKIIDKKGHHILNGEDI